MKKSTLSLLVLSALFTTAAVRVQNPDEPTLKLTEKTQEEIFGMLELLGAEAWRFETNGLSNGRYRFTPFFDEYAGGEEVMNENQISMSMTQDWKDKPSDPDEWNKFLAENNPRLSEDGGKYLKPLEDIGVFIVPRNDSVVMIRVDIYGVGSQARPLKLKPLQNTEDNPRYTYDYRPFKIEPLEARKQRVPLLLVGSFWWDEKAKVHRFCGVNEFASDMSDEELKSIPHYYVIGVEVEKIE